MKKKIIALSLVFILALTGCSKATSKNSNTSSSETKKESVSDTARWFNAVYGVISTRNGADINLFGGYDATDKSNVKMMKEGLVESWEVSNRKSADEKLKWALTEGHNKELLAEYKDNDFKSLSRNELVSALSDKSYKEEDRVYFLGIYDAVDKYGDNAIRAWDLSRAMQLSAWYYIAGYYTYEEAMDSCLKIAQELQKTYSSWDDMMDSYFYGFQYWNGDDMSDPDSESYARKQTYEMLKKQKNSPYSLDWNMKLQKDW
ncbi:DUF1266 domain-containing protein [Anaeromicropila herbilytica]|uniref:DUF1266 domain-containing protein n=1 Tax=Anaeromicropila herbilytica TaxID=2785025 RepID=A0A7R7ELP6_9FIRM|nr:DUF1266 domain-containing protein [Anaeromicropila herbilytica]BCN30916.1 hypothetical protein bsdtb5_22110 [Anaeromicropila herbilytica]